MAWLWFTLFGIVLFVAGFFFASKARYYDDAGIIVSCAGFVIALISVIILIIMLICKKDSTLFYYNKLDEAQRIEAYGKMISQDNDEAIKAYADMVYKYNKEITEEQRTYKVYGNTWSFRNKIIMDLKPLEYDKMIPVKTLRIIE